MSKDSAGMRILIGICSAGRYAERRSGIRETWLRDLPPNVHAEFFLGLADGPVEEGTVRVNAPDDYEHLPQKVMEYFRYALRVHDFDVLFKCDDDTYVVPKRLVRLASLDADFIGSAQLEREGFASGGAGYCLRRSLLSRLVEEPLDLRGAEDVMISSAALRLTRRWISTSALYPWDALIPSPDNSLVTGHWCSPERMRQIHSSFTRHSSRQVCGTFRVVHASWAGEVTLFTDGRFIGGALRPDGRWSVSPDGAIFTLRWLHWPEDTLFRTATGFASEQHSMTFASEEDERAWRLHVPDARAPLEALINECPPGGLREVECST